MNMYKQEKKSNIHNRYNGVRSDESFINKFSLLDNLGDFSVSKCFQVFKWLLAGYLLSCLFSI